MASLRTFARKVAADDETWRNNNQTWARANFSFFLYFLFQIKWHFEFFFYWKMGGGYPPYPPPLYPPLLQDVVRMEGYHERKSRYYLYNWLLIWLYNLSQLVWQICFSQKTIILCYCQNVTTSWTVYNGDKQHLLCVFLNGGCHSFTRGWIESHLLRIFRRLCLSGLEDIVLCNYKRHW